MADDTVAPGLLNCGVFVTPNISPRNCTLAAERRGRHADAVNAGLKVAEEVRSTFISGGDFDGGGAGVGGFNFGTGNGGCSGVGDISGEHSSTKCGRP